MKVKNCEKLVATPNFMSAQTVTWSGSSTPGTWTYSPTRYWPRTGSGWANVHFFAYSPSTVTFVGVMKNYPQLHFTAPTDPAAQTDLIVDAVCNATGENITDKVMFKFDHVLSRIGFKVKLQDGYDGTTVTLSSVRFFYSSALKASGTYTFSGSTVTGSNKASGNWSTTGASVYTDQYTDNLLISPPSTLTTNSIDISNQNESAGYLMLIPQKITEKLTPVALIYDIYYPLGAGTVTQHYEMSTYLPETTWEPGKAYTYTLIVAPRKLEVGVEENWDNWDNSNTDVLVP